MTQFKVKIQQNDFDLAAEYAALRKENPQAGAIVTFSGLVRDFNADGDVDSIFLEHYPAMTDKTLHKILQQASERWPLCAVTVIHRVGLIKGQEQIVLVGVASLHRHAAYSAAEFVMDFLKTEAPFWKREQGSGGSDWVEAKDTDQRARERW